MTLTLGHNSHYTFILSLIIQRQHKFHILESQELSWRNGLCTNSFCTIGSVIDPANHICLQAIWWSFPVVLLKHFISEASLQCNLLTRMVGLKYRIVTTCFAGASEERNEQDYYREVFIFTSSPSLGEQGEAQEIKVKLSVSGSSSSLVSTWNESM